jgi:hypothetical protein
MSVIATLLIVLAGAILWAFGLQWAGGIVMAVGLIAALLALFLGYGRGDTVLDPYLPLKDNDRAVA